MTTNATASDAITPTTTLWQRGVRRVWIALRVVVVLAAIAGAGWWVLLAPVKVTTHRVTAGTVTAEVLGTGTLEARVSAAVGPKVAGLITRVAADQGDHVKAGDTLVFLEDTDARQLVAVAEADVEAVKAGLDRLSADGRRAEAVLAQAMRTHERLERAAASGAASTEEVDKAAEALAVAESESARAKAALVEGAMRLAAAERTLDYQRARLNDTTIEAPFDALVVRRDRDAGDVVTAGSTVLQLVSLDELWIRAWADETELSRLAEGQPARVVFRSESAVEYPGVVARVGREADRETREIVVEVRVERLPVTWAVGQRAEVYIRVDQREGVTVLPASLVLVRDGQTGVMVSDAGRARWRRIEIGLRGREFIEITNGLAPGEVVVSPSPGSSGPLRDGRRTSAE